MAACSLLDDSTGLGEYEGVRVTASLEGDSVVRTIRNGSAVPITRHFPHCDAELYNREGDSSWELPEGAACLDVSTAPVEIAPGEERVSSWWGLNQLEPGDHRFELKLRGPDGELLPQAARSSNWFRVE
ncbi:MAG: hypothetical protein GEU90_00525 [Gemmatimonas sp.]|nr:hypothetical protein [Gemmatimonas sp.]